MDAITLQARINAGLAVAARVLGRSWQFYQPTDALSPMTGTGIIVAGAIDRDPDRSQRAPAGYGDAVRYWVGDASALAAGGLLVGSATMFVASVPDNSAPLLIDCNTTIDLLDLQASSSYGGATEQVVASGWPASLRLSGRGGNDLAGLPDGEHEAALLLLLPAIPGIVLHNRMRARDGLGRRLVLTGVEISALGYRISAHFGDS